jgi:hypothetical protein
MHEFLLVWRLWKPTIYKMIEIIPDRIVDRRVGAGSSSRAISAFSGGVDANFTALRHAKSMPENTRYPLTDVVMVHGFDVEIENHTDFNKLKTRVKPLIDELGLHLRLVRTNSKDLKLQDWEDSFATELAGCLHMMSDEFQYGLIGSSEDYSALVLPWGSSPVTDHLMSGDAFKVVHEGAGYSRTDKVAEIRRHELACKTLKVCHAGADQSGNCGRCEKCVRTQMNFLAAGATKMPPCFKAELDLDCIRTIQVANKTQLAELVSIANHAKAHHVTGEWMDVLAQTVQAWQPIDPAVLARKRHGSLAKRSAIKIVTAMGLREPAKKVWRTARRKILKNLAK